MQSLPYNQLVSKLLLLHAAAAAAASPTKGHDYQVQGLDQDGSVLLQMRMVRSLSAPKPSTSAGPAIADSIGTRLVLLMQRHWLKGSDFSDVVLPVAIGTTVLVIALAVIFAFISRSSARRRSANIGSFQNALRPLDEGSYGSKGFGSPGYGHRRPSECDACRSPC
mmetsp:Transcript_112454/g.223464  ORF Transcript_112454/g.223464 Transcript_112454/m.223464 type:complete len:166 (-) Transcript_112454:84-581(-)